MGAVKMNELQRQQRRAAKAERRLIDREQRATRRLVKTRARLTVAEKRLVRAQRQVERRAARLADAVELLRQRQEQRAAWPYQSQDGQRTEVPAAVLIEVEVVEPAETGGSDEVAAPVAAAATEVASSRSEAPAEAPRPPARRRTRRTVAEPPALD